MARRRSTKPDPEATVTITEQPEPLAEETLEETFEIHTEKSLDFVIEETVKMEESIPPEEYIVELLPPPQRSTPKQTVELKPKPVRSKPPRNIPRFSRMA